MKTKEDKRTKRKASIRKRVNGSTERPRLTVFRSMTHMYAQVVDDAAGTTVVATSTLDKALKAELGGLKKAEQAKKVGQAIAKLCLAKGIEKVVFDRNGYLYHGRISAVADGAREGGLKF
jgi:large subunit ribosomal protein L18